MVVGTLNALYSDVDMGSQPLLALGRLGLNSWPRGTIPVNLGQLLQRAGITWITDWRFQQRNEAASRLQGQ